MKQNKNIFPSLSSAAALLIATMFASCTKAELEALVVKQGAEIRFGIEKNGISKPITKSGSKSDSRVLVDYDPNDPCSLGLSMTVVDGIETPKSHLPATKGAQVSQKEQLTAFDVVSYFYADESAENGAFVFEDIVSDGVNTTKTYYWPSFGEMNFIATYPAGMFGEDGIKSIADAYGHLQSFTYTIPQVVEEQQDIMIAMTNDVDCTEGAPVPLQFKHLLAAVQFKVGEMQFIQINTLKITGVYGGEILFEYDSNNHTWIPSYDTTKTFDYDLSSVISETSGLIAGDEITSNSNSSILLVAPQRLPDSAKLVVDWTEVITGVKPRNPAEISLAGQNWEAGKTTVYALNIAATKDFGTVEIPRPEDQDAHYIMLEMPYIMDDLSDYVSSVKVTADWIDDNSQSSKDGISLLFKENLSDRQKMGYWVDTQWQRTITVIDDQGTTTESETTLVGNIRGEKDLIIPKEKLTEGTIVLFIEENNGTQHREGRLLFTATLTTGATIDLGVGEFKQLCPCWNDSGLGVERIEDGESKVHPYGFSYNRKVTYKLSTLGQLSAIVSWLAANSLSNIAPDDGVFIKYIYDKVGLGGALFGWEGLARIEINYSALSSVASIAASQDGLLNTSGLYNFTGGVDFDEIENNLNASEWLSTPTITGSSSAPEDYAAFIALSRNRMYELKTTTKAKNQKDKIDYTAVLYKEGNQDVIEWYLPSSEEAKTLHETGTADDGTAISPLNGEYWSSTAGDDNNAYAHSYTYTNNEFGSINTTKGRMENLKVRAVRKKPTAN